MCKNVAALMIVMLGYSELDMEVLDVGIETMEFNDCREMSINDGDANSMLAMTQERARFSYKDK